MFKKKKIITSKKGSEKKESEKKPYKTVLDLNELLDMEVQEFGKWWNDEGKKQADNRAPITNLPAFYLLSLMHLKQIRYNVRKIAKVYDEKNAK